MRRLLTPRSPVFDGGRNPPFYPENSTINPCIVVASNEAARRRTWVWASAAFVGALTLAVFAVIVRGANPGGAVLGLRLTARFSYLFFWFAYVGGALATLFGPALRAIGQRARELGLAFASAQLVHVGLVAWLAWLSQPESLTDAVMPFFGVAFVWTYLLAALSTNYARRVVSPYLLKNIFTIGSEYIALTFFTDFVIIPKYPIPNLIFYIPFWVMLLLGPLLRIAAVAKKFLKPMAPAPS